MTVQELYELTRKNADPSKVELRLRPDGDEIVEVEFEKDENEFFAYLIEERSIHL
jgi:hypothetical protein